MTSTLRKRLSDSKSYIDKQLAGERARIPGGADRIWVDPDQAKGISDSLGDAIEHLDTECGDQ